MLVIAGSQLAYIAMTMRPVKPSIPGKHMSFESALQIRWAVNPRQLFTYLIKGQPGKFPSACISIQAPMLKLEDFLSVVIILLQRKKTDISVRENVRHIPTPKAKYVRLPTKKKDSSLDHDALRLTAHGYVVASDSYHMKVKRHSSSDCLPILYTHLGFPAFPCASRSYRSMYF